MITRDLLRRRVAAAAWRLIVPSAVVLAAALAGVVPTSSAEQCVHADSVRCSPLTIVVRGVYDGGGKTVPGIDGQPGEGHPMVMEVFDGATVRNVTIGRTTAGIACLGSCTLQNIHWTYVGDFAVAALGGPGTVARVEDSRVEEAFDKAFQHNGAGTVSLENITLGPVGHIYASCGSCDPAIARNVVARNVHARTARSDGFAVQLRDPAPLIERSSVGPGRSDELCSLYEGNNSLHRPCPGVG